MFVYCGVGLPAEGWLLQEAFGVVGKGQSNTGDINIAIATNIFREETAFVGTTIKG